MRGHTRRRGKHWCAVLDIGRDERGARKQRWLSGFATKKDAERALADAINRLNAGTDVEPNKQTLRDFMREWLDANRTRLRPSTWQSYATNIESHIIPRLGTIKLQALNAAQLNRFYADLMTDGRRDGRGALSARTVRYVHMVLRRALSDGLRWQRLVRNVADQADPPKPKPTTEMRTWTALELRQFLEGIGTDRLYAAWMVAASTGMRRGEVLGMRWRDVDLAAGRISVVQTLLAVRYKIEFSTPKTAKGRRLVALDPNTTDALRVHRRRQLEERLAMGPGFADQDLVFSNVDGSPIHPDQFSSAFDRLQRVVSLPRIRLHDLRHTHATLALRAGVHPKVVSERLGHATVSITLDTYSHAIPAMQEEAANLVAAMVFGA